MNQYSAQSETLFDKTKQKKIKKIKPNLLNFGTYIYYSKIYQNEN